MGGGGEGEAEEGSSLLFHSIFFLSILDFQMLLNLLLESKFLFP